MVGILGGKIFPREVCDGEADFVQGGLLGLGMLGPCWGWGPPRPRRPRPRRGCRSPWSSMVCATSRRSSTGSMPISTGVGSPSASPSRGMALSTPSLPRGPARSSSGRSGISRGGCRLSPSTCHRQSILSVFEWRKGRGRLWFGWSRSWNPLHRMAPAESRLSSNDRASSLYTQP